MTFSSRSVNYSCNWPWCEEIYSHIRRKQLFLKPSKSWELSVTMKESGLSHFCCCWSKMFSVCFPSLSTDLIGLWLMIWCDAADAIEKPIIQQRELLANVCPFHWEAEKKQKKSNFALVDLLVAQHDNLCTGKWPIRQTKSTRQYTTMWRRRRYRAQ